MSKVDETLKALKELSEIDPEAFETCAEQIERYLAAAGATEASLTEGEKRNCEQLGLNPRQVAIVKAKRARTEKNITALGMSASQLAACAKLGVNPLDLKKHSAEQEKRKLQSLGIWDHSRNG